MNLDNLDLTRAHRDAYGFINPAGQRVLDNRAAVLAAIREREPEAHVTFFPVEQQYQVHVWGRPLSEMHPTYGSALAAAYRKVYP